MKNIAVVGVGNYAESYLKIIEKLEKERAICLFCAVVRDREKYPKTTKALDRDGVVIYSSFETMLKYGKTKVDIVALPIASKDHFHFVQQALEHGYDVIVEKPVALTIQEVDQLIETQKVTERYCIVGNEFLYSSSINLICNEIQSGRLGPVKSMSGMFGWACGQKYFKRNDWAGKLTVDGLWNLDGPATNHGASVLSNAIHIIQSTCNPGVEIESVQAELYRAYEISSYDTAAIRAKMSNGATIFFVASYAIEKDIQPTMQMTCENAGVIWNFENEKTVIRYNTGRKKIFRERHVEQKYESIFREAITVTTTRARKSSSNIQNARSHVLLLNLAFESAGEIVTIPQKYLSTVKNKTVQKTFVKDMDQIIAQAYAEEKLFSELNVPWAKATPGFAKANYNQFPQNGKLAALLDKK